MKTTQLAFSIAGWNLESASLSGGAQSSAEIRKIIADRPGTEDLGVGVVGVIDANGCGVASYGSLAKTNNRRLDGILSSISARSPRYLRTESPLQSVKFTGVNPAGADIYEVTCEHGTTKRGVMRGAIASPKLPASVRCRESEEAHNE